MSEDKRLRGLIQAGETSRVEFKASLRFDLKERKVNKNLTDVVAKTLAGFINSEGGTLLIGIADDGQIVGIEHDLETLTNKSPDGFELALRTAIGTYLGRDVSAEVRVRFTMIDEKQVAEVVCQKSPEPLFLKDGDKYIFYVRDGCSTRPLNAFEQHNYIKKHYQALMVKRIIDQDDPDLYSIWELQAAEFSDATGDNYDDMKGWISEIDENYAQDGEKFDDIMLALKLRDEVVGYLYAQHYVNRQIIFISYLGYNEQIREARNGVGPTELLKKLIKICERSSPPWKAVVGEVEQIKRGRAKHSHDLFVKFRWCERGLRELFTTPGKLFMLDFDYIQPAIKPDDIKIDVSNAPDLVQKLLFFARDVNSLHKDPTGKPVLTGDEAIKLFDAVISCVYGDAYRDDEEYQQYLRDTQARYRPRLEEGVRLIDK